MHLIGETQPTKILVASGDEKHLQALDFGSKGGSSSWGSSGWGSSSSSYYGPAFFGGYGYSSNNNAQNRKRQLISVFTCLM